MAINAGTVAAYLTLDTSKYLQSLKDATEQTRLFKTSSGEANVSLELLKNTASITEMYIGKNLSGQIKSTTENVSLLDKVFSELNNALSKTEHIEAVIQNLGKLSNEAVFTAASLGDLSNTVTTEMLFNFDLLMDKKKLSFKEELEEFGKTEQEKVIIFSTELTKREQMLKKSLDENKTVLKSFVPTFASIGEEYGNALLNGIQSTRNRILNYISQIASAVRNAANYGSYTPYFNGYSSGTNNAAAGLSVVGENGMPEIVDFSGGEQVVNFKDSIQLLNTAAKTAFEYSNAFADILYSNKNVNKDTNFDYNQLSNTIVNAVTNAIEKSVKPNIVYSPTYNSPAEASISELMQQDKINLRRIGLGF